MSQTEKLHDATRFLQLIHSDLSYARAPSKRHQSPLLLEVFGVIALFFAAVAFCVYFSGVGEAHPYWSGALLALAFVLCAMTTQYRINRWKHIYPALPTHASFTDRLFWALARYPVEDEITREMLVRVQDAVEQKESDDEVIDKLDQFVEAESVRLGILNARLKSTSPDGSREQFLNRPLRDQNPIEDSDDHC